MPPYHLRKTLVVLFTTKTHRTTSILCAFAVSLFFGAIKLNTLLCKEERPHKHQLLNATGRPLVALMELRKQLLSSSKNALQGLLHCSNLWLLYIAFCIHVKYTLLLRQDILSYRKLLFYSSGRSSAIRIPSIYTSFHFYGFENVSFKQRGKFFKLS